MLALQVERLANINLTPSHSPYNSNMSSEGFLQFDAEFEHILSQLEQDLLVREQVATALNEANNVFVAQFTQPNGYTFMQTCDKLLDFLSLKIPLIHDEQKQVCTHHIRFCSLADGVLARADSSGMPMVPWTEFKSDDAIYRLRVPCTKTRSITPR